jgi:hypothetical protein
MGHAGGRPRSNDDREVKDGTVRQSIGRLAVAATVVVVTLLAIAASPAGAAVTGPCDAAGAIGATTYVPRRIRGNEVVTVPKSAKVRWEGSVTRPAGRRVPYRGEVAVTVAGFDVTVDEWRGTTGKMAVAGARAYDAGVLPGGVVYRLHGSHHQGRLSCRGEMLVQLEGGKGVAVPIAFAGTAATFSLLAWFAARGRRVRGALAGLVLGGFVALDLVLFARADLASRDLLVFPIAGLVLGAIVPTTRRRRPTSRWA